MQQKQRVKTQNWDNTADDQTGTLRCSKCKKSAMLKYGLCADCRRDILRREQYEKTTGES